MLRLNYLDIIYKNSILIKNFADAFYYNQQGKNCSYYTEQAFTIADAMKLYLLHGIIRRHLNKRQ